MSEKLSEVLDVTVDLFKTAKRVRKKHGEYYGVSWAIKGLEIAAIETMCGTANVNYAEYIESFYKGLIDVEELLQMAYPKRKDAEDGHYE